MKLKYFTFLFLLLSFFYSCKESEASKPTVKQELLVDLSKLSNEITQFQKLVKSNSSQEKIVEQFKKSRLAYKKVEWAIEYFIPETARFMNGPALDEMELEENRSFEPHGFQVMEEMIYPEYNLESKEDLTRELNIFQSNIKQLKSTFEVITISDDYVLDAIQQNVFRVVTLGITGFDSPILQSSIPEAGQSLISIPETLEKINADNKSVSELRELTKNAQKYCSENNNFNAFNRAVFITEYLNPISKKLKTFQKEENIKNVKKSSPLKPTIKTLFDKDAFDVNAFVLSKEYNFTKEKAALGEKLFYDTSLSKNNDRSCATCHNPEKAFTDGLKTNVSLTGMNLPRNTPTLTYASLQNAQFWDMRQLDLEKQSVDVIQNKDEMHGSMENIHAKIQLDKEYVKLFKKAYPKISKPEAWQIQNAIASYVRSLNSFDSRFDEYMRGNKNVLNNEEIEGMNLFMGKAKCATCHFTPLFNGTVPPSYSKTEHEVIGTPNEPSGKSLSPDKGRYIYNQMSQLVGAFKTPTVRNAAVTAPYMHNGVFKTLEEVVSFYNKGGGIGLGYKVENQTLPFDKLNLTVKEEKALVAFMKTLTDKKYQ
ncbi:cytochrome-c peroxidase [Flavobacterium nitrogenifigens]|uniref:Cytochrome c peroxidase n=1 Tax=Flavobacterium nitrogenifigens TaxID=1617283 RepID=A0A521AU98_9FLAO|nr:cytochrome c peroxidase [Flavobacterium nitrogenifigens]KAF2329234.1 cytochrome-c peroxidase [Flavobacterium nitrogenifigens]SMO38389.1 cytochrome c peroxidase [Flavobacterium nitrogenifigens]